MRHDALAYFGMYTFALRMETDPELKVLAVQRFMDVNYEKNATKGGFLNKFICREVFGLCEELVQVEYLACNNRDSFTIVMMAAIPEFLRAGLERVDNSDIRVD